MECIALTHIGMEKLAKQEIDSLLDVDSSVDKAVITFPVKAPLQICSVVYQARLLQSAIYKILSFRLKDVEDFEKKIDPEEFKGWITSETTFAVRCIKVGEQLFSSKEIEQELGAILFNRLKAKVNLSNPDVTVLVYLVDNECYVGIDFAGIDLSKREYRIFSYGDPLKGTTAQAMNYVAGIQSGATTVDPFSSSGIIPIEAALFLSNKSVHFYDKDNFAFLKLQVFDDVDFDKFFEDIDKKMKESKAKIFCSDFLQKSVRAAEKNAKIAGVNKQISFSRSDIEWLDTKFEENSIDSIVTFPPQISKRTNQGQTVKILDELFYVSKIILSDKGKIVMIFNKPELLETPLKKHSFSIAEKLDVWQGAECLHILVIQKS